MVLLVLPNLNQGGGIFLAGVGIGILLIFAGRAGFRHISMFGFTFQRPRDKSVKELEWDREDAVAERSADHRQVEDSFRRYAEAAVGMAAMVEAAGPADRSLTSWFDLVASAVATGLTAYPEDHFRVAIWADLGDPRGFHLLGSANHDRNDPRMRILSKEKTIGGHAWQAKAGEYLCGDVTKDRKFKARSATPRPYKAIFAIRVGEPSKPWGVMTIDAPRIDSFGQTELIIARRFAQLASAGAAIATARYSPLPSRTSAALPAGPASIVTIDAPAATHEAEEGPDGQP